MNDSAPGTPAMRSDARRNYERLLHVAQDAFARQGVNASLTEVARRAGVGIGTLYRHFPTREALIDAVLRERFDRLSAKGAELLETRSPEAALLDWLRLVVSELTSFRGLGASVAASLDGMSPDLADSCAGLRRTADDLLTHARVHGVVRDTVTVSDLLRFANAIALATERSPRAADDADRMLDLLMSGLRLPA
ncbi:TetR/AcrR family transcriptional regulator [Nonomuraea sp. NPDC049309]|uniref:TetR/AcrR family transcriptional regulator n=1 Tax=Nonomuraea sp. NPDC049309 TaxID=3364350 RepID=UPI0037190678